MYFGQGSKSDPNSQKSSHILQTSADRNAPPPPSNPKATMHQDVMAFERKLQYDNLVHSGVSPVRAAQQVGSHVPSGSMLTPKDIQQIIETGSVRKSRVG